MSPGHGQPVDLDEELAGELPAPYCEGNWRQVVGGCAVMAMAVLVISLGSYYQGATELGGGPMAAAEVGPTWLGEPMAAGVSTTAPVAQVAASLPVGASASDGNVRLVRGAARTAFNTAARSIRPSVMGIRATVSPSATAGARVDRVGSGVVVTPDGYVVTCYHVVAGTSAIAVSPFEDPSSPLPAMLVAARDDLALLKVSSPTPLVAAPLASSENVQVGDWVLAVGYPFGLGLTVTAGIVGRRHGVLNVPGGRQYTGLLQTDAPINEGSSGGPLVDLDGRVVGLNTAIYAPTGVFSGAGFAIPSAQIASFLSASMPGFRGVAGGSSRMAWASPLGAETQPTRATEAGWPNANP